MANENFTIWTNQTFTNSGITGNGTFDLAISGTQSNTIGLKSLRLVCEYVSASPSSNLRNFDLLCLIDSSNGLSGASKKWFPMAYHFEPFRRDNKGMIRNILMQPDMVVIDVGIDDVLQVGGDSVSRISRQQGKLGPEFRVRLSLTEFDFGGPGAFQSVTVNVYGEKFDV